MYPSWVDLLHSQALPLVKDAADWVALHVQLAEVCRSGIAAVGDTNPQQRALLQAALGRTLVHHAERVQSESDRRRMYLEAIDALVLARRDEAVRFHSQFVDMLGLGYLRLGMLENDPQLLERGVTVYRELLEREPNNVTARYNLACVYAQLGRPEEAVEQLRVLVVTGNRKDLLENSAQDPDLAPMRESTAYRVLLLEQQQAHSEAKAQQLAEIGDMLQRESVNVQDQEQRLERLKQATSRYQEALQLMPDNVRANRGMGMCLVEFTMASSNRAEQRELADGARRHLQKALDSGNSDAATFGVLAAFYLGAYNALLTDPDQQINLMGEVIRICRLGLEKARFSVDIARLQAQIGEASTRRAILSQDPKAQREDYLQAIAAFETAGEVETVGQTPRLNELWGVALLRYSSLTKDRLYTRRAIERLLHVLEEDPDHASINYNLSCAYALVGDAKMWQKYYQRSTENDTEGQFYQAALTDPDLDRIRHLPEYQEIFGGHLLPGQLVDPRLTR